MPPAAPDSDTFHHIATYLHHILMHVVNRAVKGQSLQAGGLAPYCTRFGYVPSDSYISAHIHTHAIRYCKRGCERADPAHIKSSKERVKGIDYVNSTRLILQYIV